LNIPKCMIVIIDYGMGNVGSILNMYKKLGISDVIVTNQIKDVTKADRIILPGVGAFDNGMINLKKSGVLEILNTRVIEDKIPVLGICLGMQLLTKKSEEGVEPGLGWVDAEVKKFDFDGRSDYKIPHMGWNYIAVNKTNQLIGQSERNRFYFVHSYYVQCNNNDHILASCDYGDSFTASFQSENMYGVQFHPEKSHKFGMKLLKNFSEL